MVALTKDEYDASDCLGKRHTISMSYFGGETKDSFYICSNCHPHRSDSSGPCLHELRGRCKEDPDGPSAEDILTTFILEGDHSNEDRTSMIRLFCQHFGRCWECSGCEYWELPHGERSMVRTAFSTTHGAKSLISEITGFCTYFIVRKCMLCQEERKFAVLCMMELVSFLVAKGYLPDGKQAERIISAIRPGLTFEPDTMQQKLNELWANDYWRKLLEGKASSKKAKTANSDEPSVGTKIEPGIPWTVKKITSTGWLLSNWDTPKDTPKVEVLLPDDVRKLGVEDMEISCMKVVYIGCGIWEPSGAYGEDEMVCANIYPP